MRKILSGIIMVLYTAAYAQPHELTIDLSGNGYVTNEHEGARITKRGLSRWTSPESVVSIYFYLHEATTADLSLIARGNSEIKVSYGEESFNVTLDSEDFADVAVGTVNIKEPGYVRIDLQGISKNGFSFGEVRQLIAKNVTCESNYVNNYPDYWARRGPSVHLAYTLPKGEETEWFYNEVTVPEDGETMHSYYMAAGFGEGYFGMQYNSPTERRILFSVWSPYETQDPKEIPEDQKIKLLRRGNGVHIGEFGNEGSGGQSYLNYPWKAGNTYKFLMQVKPDENGNTAYTAYFYATDEEEWKLIASFLRPNTTTWYRHAHSFLENFSPEQGYLSRKVLFGNQWARSNKGNWNRITEATFTHDDTAKAQVRLDYQGGKTDDNRYYLKMGGFFNEHVRMGTKFNCEPTDREPQIDFSTLQQL